MEDNQRCFWHEDSVQLRKEKGFITGGCAIRWDIPCGGRPDLVPGHHQCPGQYITIEDANRANKSLDILHAKHDNAHPECEV